MAITDGSRSRRGKKRNSIPLLFSGSSGFLEYFRGRNEDYPRLDSPLVQIVFKQKLLQIDA